MMTGSITSEREAVLSLSIRNSDGVEVTVQALVDTGYNGTLTLPQAIIDTLALPWHGARLVTLADGSTVELGIYRAHVLWHDEERAVQSLAADGGPLLGMALLYGSRLTMDILDGSAFTIAPLV